MQFKRIIQNNRSIGWTLEMEGALVVFGNKHATAEALSQKFSLGPIRFLKQVHGAKILENTSSEQREGDGHWTGTVNTPIGVHTADCLPVLLYSAEQKKAYALHAGWRGVEARIIPEAMKDLKNAFCFIGPHISKRSFEVGNEVAERLAKSSPKARHYILNHPSEAKKYVDLASIVIDQFSEFGGSKPSVYAIEDDTYTNLDYFSYRREGKTGRLISFISLR